MLFYDGFYKAEFMERGRLELESGSFLSSVLQLQCLRSIDMKDGIILTLLNEAFPPASLCKVDLKDR